MKNRHKNRNQNKPPKTDVPQPANRDWHEPFKRLVITRLLSMIMNRWERKRVKQSDARFEAELVGTSYETAQGIADRLAEKLNFGANPLMELASERLGPLVESVAVDAVVTVDFDVAKSDLRVGHKPDLRAAVVECVQAAATAFLSDRGLSSSQKAP